MRLSGRRPLVLACVVSAWSSVATANDSTFYVVSNKADGNTILGYEASDDGHYEMIGEFRTGGTGTGDLEIPALQKDQTNPLANGDDPLISANALAAPANGKYVVAVNPGDATISLMDVKRNGSLEMKSKADATDFPSVSPPMGTGSPRPVSAPIMAAAASAFTGSPAAS